MNKKFVSFLILISFFIFLINGCKTRSKKDFKKKYYSSGELKSRGFYISDTIPVDTIYTFFKNGKLSSLEVYNSIGNAVKSVSYYENGKQHKVINYKNGLANGFFNTYNSTGKIINRAFYYNDRRIGDCYFYEKNSLTYNFYEAFIFNVYSSLGYGGFEPENGKDGQDGTGSNSTVEYNPYNRNDGSDKQVPVVNEDGTVGAPASVFLGHELGHAQDIKNGTNDKNIDPTKTDPDTKQKGVLTNGEIKARETENKIRTENKIVERESHY